MWRSVALVSTVVAFLAHPDTAALAQSGRHARGPAAHSPARVREGLASYYGPGLQGRLTASGTRMDMNAMIAAHPTYPFGTVVRVTNLKNKRSTRVRIEDRGPTRHMRDEGVIIDVSRAAAEALDFIDDGRVRVRVEVLKWGA